MAFPDDFESECLYARPHWYLHDVLEIDREAHRVVGWLDTARIGALVDAQIAWPGHEKHLPGAVAIQMTGTLANLHAVYCMDLRPSQGWVGYGTHIKSGRFPRLGRIGPPVIATAEATRRRMIRGTWFIDYAFRYEQEDALVYESIQVAAWGRAPEAP